MYWPWSSGPPVAQRSGHPADDLGVGRAPVQPEHHGNTAHQLVASGRADVGEDAKVADLQGLRSS